MYNTSKVAIGELIGYILGGTALNYVGHRDCVLRASMGARKDQKHVEMSDLARQKELSGGQDRSRLHREISNGGCISAIPHRLKGKELSQG